jgi:heptose-I-phosphate ethanolaminephosphotransferase
MKNLLYRTLIGLAGLALFFLTGQLSGKEFLRQGGLMGAVMLGLGGVFLFWMTRPRWAAVLARIVYPLFFLDAAVKGFLRQYFGMRPNFATVMQAACNTNAGESREFLLSNWRALVLSAGFFVAVCVLAALTQRRLPAAPGGAPSSRAGRSFTAARALSGVMLLVLFSLHANTSLRRENPALFWPLRYLEHRRELADMNRMRALVDAGMRPRAEWAVRYQGAPGNTLVLVIGESTNRADMSLYGYERGTTPALDALRGSLVVFRDVISSRSTTAGSLINMLTPADLAHPDDWHRKPDVVMLARAAGYKTFWISNQARNDGWVGMISAGSDERSFINNGAGREENNLDENLLPAYEEALADRAPRKLIVVHLLGAHPTYDMRYPARFARFDGDDDDAVARKMKRDGRSSRTRRLRAEYDNAVLYDDYVVGALLRSAMRQAPGQPASLLFVSDHGQEVGHYRDHAGHSSADRSGYEVPMLLWQNAPAPRAAGAALEDRPYQTDRLDSTLLGLLHIGSAYYNAGDDIVSAEFRPARR